MESTQTPVTSGQSQSNDRRHRCRHRGRGAIAAILLTALIAGAAGVLVGKSFAGEHGPLARASLVAGDPAAAGERIERLVKHFAVEVDATPEQRQRLETIAKDAAAGLAPLAATLREGRKQAVRLLGAPNVDHAAIEQLRAEQIRLADTASQRLAQAIAQVADVLTPEQRQKLAARMNDRIERFERFRRG